MTRDEVEAAVGGPPGYYARGSVVGRDDPGAPARPLRWTADDGELQVGFGADGRATTVHVAPVVPRPRFTPLVQRVLNWLTR